MINFTKMHGCSNDFLIIDLRQKIPPNFFTPNRIKSLADYKKSIGFDQLLLVNASNKADISMQIYNSDGTEAEACGNGSRCVAKLYFNKDNNIAIETKNRIIFAKKENEIIAINMGKPKINSTALEFDSIKGYFVDVGNPHIIVDITSLSDDNLYQKYGPKIENDSRFINKVNVNFVKVKDKNTVLLSTWERGAGPTLACGTGACASFALLNAKNIVNNKAIIKQKGGDLTLSIENGDIIMAGEAEISYQGTLNTK